MKQREFERKRPSFHLLHKSQETQKLKQGEPSVVSVPQLGTSGNGGASSITRLLAQYEHTCSLEPTGFCYFIDVHKL